MSGALFATNENLWAATRALLDRRGAGAEGYVAERLQSASAAGDIVAMAHWTAIEMRIAATVGPVQ